MINQVDISPNSVLTHQCLFIYCLFIYSHICFKYLKQYDGLKMSRSTPLSEIFDYSCKSREYPRFYCGKCVFGILSFLSPHALFTSNTCGKLRLL